EVTSTGNRDGEGVVADERFCTALDRHQGAGVGHDNAHATFVSQHARIAPCRAEVECTANGDRRHAKLASALNSDLDSLTRGQLAKRMTGIDDDGSILVRNHLAAGQL